MSDEKEFDEWLQRASKGSAEGISKSALFASIVTDKLLESPLCMLQLGMAICMGKPIILIVDKDTQLPPDLVKIAKVIERIDTTKPGDMKRASESIASFAETLKEK